MQVVELTSAGSWALWMYMTLAQVYKAIITGLCFTSVFICISNSAPNAKKVSLRCVTPGSQLCTVFLSGCVQLALNADIMSQCQWVGKCSDLCINQACLLAWTWPAKFSVQDPDCLVLSEAYFVLVIVDAVSPVTKQIRCLLAGC